MCSFLLLCRLLVLALIVRICLRMIYSKLFCVWGFAWVGGNLSILLYQRHGLVGSFWWDCVGGDSVGFVVEFLLCFLVLCIGILSVVTDRRCRSLLSFLPWWVLVYLSLLLLWIVSLCSPLEMVLRRPLLESISRWPPLELAFCWPPLELLVAALVVVLSLCQMWLVCCILVRMWVWLASCLRFRRTVLSCFVVPSVLASGHSALLLSCPLGLRWVLWCICAWNVLVNTPIQAVRAHMHQTPIHGLSNYPSTNLPLTYLLGLSPRHKLTSYLLTGIIVEPQ